MNEDYANAKYVRGFIEHAHKRASERLKAAGAGSGPMGLTPDEIKQSDAYREARKDQQAAFAALRVQNAYMVRRFKAEMQVDRKRP